VPGLVATLQRLLEGKFPTDPSSLTIKDLVESFEKPALPRQADNPT
jgi:hypothetical protein